MPKLKNISYETVKTMTENRESQEAIGEACGCTRQRISQIQGELRAKGEIPAKTKAVGRPRKDGHKVKTIIPTQIQPPISSVDMESVSLAWDDKEQAIFRMMLQARVAQNLAIRVQSLEEENKKLKDENQRIYKDTRYKQQWDQAVQQGQVNPPLSSNLTEHIISNGLYAPEFSYNKCLPHNIMLEALLFSMEYNISQPVILRSSDVRKGMV